MSNKTQKDKKGRTRKRPSTLNGGIPESLISSRVNKNQINLYAVPSHQEAARELTQELPVITVNEDETQNVYVQGYKRVEKQRTYKFVCEACSKPCQTTTFYNRVPQYGHLCESEGVDPCPVKERRKKNRNS